ncbi:MAG: glycosyltransferase family 2 protein [Planctomycetes bacterium]|nr:glycosyltransferase family 2 protein [Planctomycetota bacterium]MCB9870412.1 glycosyltransferase family 2 protein [Planctomycetota bacterium]MCB9889403.1 glycosyltransferase family 2 protein [Planctomycetota bacterium]
MRVSLVIPTLNAGSLLEDVLRGIDAQPGADRLERVAVDSGSTDGTCERLAAHGFTVHGIDKRAFNHGTTRDLAIGKTSGEVVVLLTQDAVPTDDRWLPMLVAAYQDPAVGAAYCRQIPRDDCNPLIKKRILEWTAGRPDPVVQRLEGARQAEFDALAPLQRLQLCAYDNVAGSVRRSTWEQHPFGYRRFGEDVAFGKRLILAGHSIVYEPRSAVVHSHNRTPKEEGKRIFCDHENLRDLFDVHVLPTWADFRRASRDGQVEMVRIVDQLDLPESQRGELRTWAAEYAKWSALGIYLGGNATRLRRGWTGLWFRRVERHLRRGI